MTAPLPVDQVAIRLADEGVPLRAIARATNTPSADIREKLHAACDKGTLVGLPQEDWPPGFPRDQRALQLSRMVMQDPLAVSLAIQRVLSLTPTEVTLLMPLLSCASVPKERVDMGHKTVDVHIHNLRRRLAPLGVEIETLWGYGYQMPYEDRRKIMDLILTKEESHGAEGPETSDGEAVGGQGS